MLGPALGVTSIFANTRTGVIVVGTTGEPARVRRELRELYPRIPLVVRSESRAKLLPAG
jgi:dihydrodipicolinate reductase